LRHAAAPQYSSEAALCRAEGLKTAVGGLPRKAATFGVFVLGGTGLIGATVVRELVRRGHRFFGLARPGALAAGSINSP